MSASFLARLRAAPLSFPEFVTMMAASMAIFALAIDTMLPALPAIGGTFRVTEDNQLQWVITLYVTGGGFGQLLYGPLSDRFGRRPILLIGLLLYAALSLLASFATSLPMLLGLRISQGVSAAVGTVIPRSIVRDRHGGAQMSKVISITYIVFLTVPVLAPTIGQALLLILPWQGIFSFLAVFACIVACWIALRLPETRHPDHLRSLSPAHMADAAWRVLREPTSIFYTVASMALMGSLMAYISTLPQIFLVAFRRPGLMPGIFALCAGSMAMTAFFNVRIVERIGMRRVSHGALTAFLLFSGLHLAVAASGQESLLSFAILQALTMGGFGLAASNFNAIAMQKMAAIAGSAASVQGVITQIGGALLGSLIGHQWQGNVTFLPAGSFCCGLVALAALLFAEQGRLFRRDRLAPAKTVPDGPQ